MRNVVLACVVAASLAGCGMDRDRNTERSGTTVAPTAEAQREPNAQQSVTSAPKPNWNQCDEHPYTPGPARPCE